MHGRRLGSRLPFVVHVACSSAGCATIVNAWVEKSPNGIWNCTDAAAFVVRVPGVLTSTTAEPTKPHPRVEFAEPLRRVTILASIPVGPVNLNPVVAFV